MNPDRPSRAERLGVCALLAAALAIRLSSWAAIFRAGRVFFVDTDDFYHLRRIMTAAADFPRLPSFDYYLGFPAGFRVNWPPLYDLFVGALTLIFGLGRPTLRLCATVAAFVPPLAGTATLWLFHRVVRRLAGREAALWALGLAALLPPLVFYSLLGRPDHHCFENFWFLAALLPALALVDGGSSRPATASLAMAMALAAGVSFWIGSLLFSGLLCAWALWELALPGRQDGRPARACFWFGAAFLMEAVLLLPICAASQWGREGAVLFDAPTLFQPLALAALGLGTLGWYWRRAEGWTGRACGACAAACLAAAFLARSGLDSLFIYTLYTGVPTWGMRTFSELQPLLAPFGRWSIDYVGPAFGWAFWTLPLLALLFARGSARGSARRLVLIWTALTGALALWQTRYALHLALPAALLLGWGCAEAVRRLSAPPHERRRPWSRAAVLLAALALLYPALKNVAALPLTKAENLTDPAGLLEACDWLRERTPATRSLWRDEGPPEYGVYAPPGIGDQVAAIAQRPAAAGNMHFLRRQMLDSIAFFFLEDPRAAYDFLRTRRFRYLLLGDLVHSGALSGYASLFGLKDFIFPPASGGAVTLPPRYWDLVYLRLYALDGSLARYGRRPLAPVEHFRLVHESRRENSGAQAWKVFEVVAGARLAGACRPGAVEASAPVRTDQGREFAWRDRTACGRDGRYALSLPYAGTYVLTSASGRRRSLAVGDADVEAGAPKRLSLR
jgi:hypothetical protein